MGLFPPCKQTQAREHQQDYKASRAYQFEHGCISFVCAPRSQDCGGATNDQHDRENGKRAGTTHVSGENMPTMQAAHMARNETPNTVYFMPCSPMQLMVYPRGSA